MKYKSKMSKSSPQGGKGCACNTFMAKDGMYQEKRNLVGTNPMKEQFEPTDSEPIRQRARMSGVCH